MKKLLFVLCLAMFCYKANAQTSDAAKYVYCELVGGGTSFGSKITVNIDFGQDTSIWSGKNKQLVDEKNKPMYFNSMIDAMNYMGYHGWEFVQAYAVSDGKGNSTTYWILKKDVSKFAAEEQNAILEGIRVKR